MIEFTNTIVIEKPVEEVFDFISNFENMSRWNYYVMEVKQLGEGAVREGTTYHQTRKTDQQKFKVVEFESNQAVAIETLPPEKTLYMRFTFEVVENGTKVVDEWQLDTKTPLFLRPLAAKKVQSAVSENLGKLKNLLETGQVTLQDGRISRYKLSDLA